MQEEKDIKQNYYCIICGNKTNDGGNICSLKCETCYKKLYLKSKSRYNYYISMDGFCAFCGNPHKLKRSEGGRILNRHHECYSENSQFSIIQISKRKEKERKKKELKEEKKLRKNEKEKFLLSPNKKVYDNFSRLVFCPYCYTYSVKYYDKWLCNECNRNIVMKNSNSNHPFGLIDTGIPPLELDFTKKDKYDIYRNHGIEALAKLTGESQHEISDFIRLYRIEEEEFRRKLKEEVKLRRKLEEEELRLSEKPYFRIFQLYCINLTGRSIVI